MIHWKCYLLQQNQMCVVLEWFAMKLKGGIPFPKIEPSSYDVLFGKMPKLPSNFNLKMKDLLNKCWHHPNAQPTFFEIVSQLKEFVEETKDLMACFNLGKLYYNVDPFDLEMSLREFKRLVHVLANKYNQEDFVIIAFELLDAI